jgi:hypothetical protein
MRVLFCLALIISLAACGEQMKSTIQSSDGAGSAHIGNLDISPASQNSSGNGRAWKIQAKPGAQKMTSLRYGAQVRVSGQ